MKPKEFEEIGHTGGKVIFHIVTDAQGKRSYQIEWTHARPPARRYFCRLGFAPGHPRSPDTPWRHRTTMECPAGVRLLPRLHLIRQPGEIREAMPQLQRLLAH